MPAFISSALRQQVIARAGHSCEYCHKPQVSFYPHEVDHVIALKHGGETVFENLAFACFQCNRHKGSDLSSIDPETNSIKPLFNPRTQIWLEHFRFDNAVIVPLTAEARVTVLLLQLNESSRVQERQALHIGS